MTDSENNEVLSFDNNEAARFFLKQSSYCGIDLPPYFEFEKLIQEISKKINGKNLSDFYFVEKIKDKKGEKTTHSKNPRNYDNNNYILFNNKDGKFAWRPLQLIHPALYVALVHKITEEVNWKSIKTRFEEFRKNKKIECFSFPLESRDQNSDKASSIKNWLTKIEQQSIDLALEFSSVLHTDISNCYGSIYTHAIEWALHGKTESKEKLKKSAQSDKVKFLGGEIDCLIRDMQYGQTNGIPQGSSLMDFIAEIVLGYVDFELGKKLEGVNFDYKIIRYRDDYRIFSDNQQDLQIIAKNLTEVLADVGMKLNEHKTIISSDIIKDSLKPDKLHFISSKNFNKNLREHLLIIYKLSLDHPNSGSLKKALKKFYDRISLSQNLFAENITNLISVIVEISYRNPTTYAICFAVLSYLLPLSESENNRILEKIFKKFKKIANAGYAEIWLQRVTLKTDPNRQYNEKLCQKVVDKKIKIWECDWLNDNLKKMIEGADIVNKEEIKEMDRTIQKEEVELFLSRIHSQ